MGEFNYNMDIETRDKIIFGNYRPDLYMGGCRRFGCLSLDKLKQLVDMGFVDVEDRQNNSPSIAEFMQWMEDYDGYYVSGYVISNKRDDYRISIETITKHVDIDNAQEMYDFYKVFGHADAFDEHGYAWWD